MPVQKAIVTVTVFHANKGFGFGRTNRDSIFFHVNQRVGNFKITPGTKIIGEIVRHGTKRPRLIHYELYAEAPAPRLQDGFSVEAETERLVMTEVLKGLEQPCPPR